MESSKEDQALQAHLNAPAFDDEIPKRGPDLFIKRMKANEVKTFTVWGSKIRGMWTHWNGATEKSEPHFSLHCRACNEGAAKRWKGFLHAYCQEDRQELFLELTPTSAQSIIQQLDDPSNMRGSVIRVKRTAASNGRVIVSLLSPITDTRALPREKDPRRSILKLWGLSDDRADQWLGEAEGESPSSHAD